MELNNKKSAKEKRAEFAKLSEDLDAGTNRADIINRLFFAARNGAIANILRNFEHYFRDNGGMFVTAKWSESSFRYVSIELTMLDKKGREHTRQIHIDRENLDHTSSVPSTQFYTLSNIKATEYYRGALPAAVAKFQEMMATPEFEKKAKEWVNGVNYPFLYESHSSF